MTFHLNISGLVAYVNIGVYNWERVIKQRVEINIGMSPVSTINDNFVDYAVFGKRITQFLSEQGFLLLEDAVDALLAFVADEYPSITNCKVEMCKPAITFGSSKKISISSGWNR